MSGKKLWWSVTAGVVAVAVAGVSGIGIVAQEYYGDLTHEPAFAVAEPTPVLSPASAETPVDNAALSTTLDALVIEDLGTLHGQVTDATTGETVWQRAADSPLKPASATKILTAAAAIYALGPEDVLTTEVVRGENPGTVVIKAAGDVWLTSEQITDLATDIGQADEVIIDTSVWTGDPIMSGWEEEDFDAGYVAPMEPAMLYGARIGATEGDVPRSHTPALDVARALAYLVGSDNVSFGTAPADTEVLAQTQSPQLIDRVEDMMVWSDNVMAEAIGHELALHLGYEGSAKGATEATLDVLADQGFDVTGVSLLDNSGLSNDNLISPRLLDNILYKAATGETLRPLLAALPVAGGSGTLLDRYSGLSGRGWVRAKTGTLTGTSALAGVVTAQSGQVYSFALLSNDSEILPARAALDRFASAIRES